MLMFMKRTTYIFLLLIYLIIATCTAKRSIRKKDVTHVLSKPVETWSFEECKEIIDRYSVANLKVDFEYRSDHSAIGRDIFIKATPFTREVIKAIVRKESIQRRFSVQEFRKRLKTELEDFTNYSLDEKSGKVINKLQDAENLLNEYTFNIYFLNMSDPYRTIQVYMAQEGFFLERDDGKFTRVMDMAGTDAMFTLDIDLYTMVTFSAFTDDGERIEFDENNMHQFKLIFTSFYKRPIKLEWKNLN